LSEAVKIVHITILLLCFLASAAAQSGKQPVSLRLKDIHGRLITLSDYQGKVVLVNFWATWCVPCRTEIPDLVKKQREYRKRDLRIIGITYPPQTLSKVRQFAGRNRMNYRVALGDKETKSLFTNSETLPISVVIDRDGTVRDVIEGIMYQDEFDQKVKPLLSSKKSILIELKPQPSVLRQFLRNIKRPRERQAESVFLHRSPLYRWDKKERALSRDDAVNGVLTMLLGKEPLR
jgi:peroxiredoxin